jgi:mono/diheme cytochrome c family protein
MKFYMLALLLLLLQVFAAVSFAVDDGETLFKDRCGVCHQYPEPGMLTPEQWHRLLDTKQKLMEKSRMQPLTAEEYKTLLEYLTKNAKQ